MKHYTAVVLGGGPSGICCADHLKRRGIDYVLLEKRSLLHTWRYERWDSFYLVTPNWMTNIPYVDHLIPYDNHFMSKNEILNVLEQFLRAVDPNYIDNIGVKRVFKGNGRYILDTDKGEFSCSNLIIATGLFNEPFIPAVSQCIPKGIMQLHSKDYLNSKQLSEGGTLVVGSGRSGIQIALDIKQQTASPVYLSIGQLTGIPSIYKNVNGVYWLNQLSGYKRGKPILPYTAEDLADLNILQKFEQNLSTCQKLGVQFLGRLLGSDSQKLSFSNDLLTHLNVYEETLRKIEIQIDGLINQEKLELGDNILSLDFEKPDSSKILPIQSLFFESDAISNIIWATGFKADYGWLDVPIRDSDGKLNLEGSRILGECISFCGLSLETTKGEESAFGVGLYALNESAEMAVSTLFE